MANPYTSVSVSGYNDSPPADDGTTTSTNEVTWSKHKTKLGDPLKTAIESINTNVTAAFAAKGATGTIDALTSSRSATFSSIPAWVTHIMISWFDVSTDGTTDELAIRIGDSGGVETTGYLGGVANASGGTIVRPTTGFQITAAVSAATHVMHGRADLTLADSATNTWCFSSTLAFSDADGVDTAAGRKALTGALDRVQFLLLGSTDNFDAGSVNIRYS